MASRILRCMSPKTDLGIGWKVLVFLCAPGLLAPPALQAQWRTPWEYEGAKGAQHWSELDPDYAACNAGKEQSPIDIQHAVRAELPTLRFEYKSGPLRYLVNNGHTIPINIYTPSIRDALPPGARPAEIAAADPGGGRRRQRRD